MLHISLFSGIGGFDLAAEWMGWTNIVSCEINDFGNKVLQHYWSNAYHHRDVKTLTLEKINEELGKNWRTDDVILTGGFPCQPYSSAGKRKGKEDERHLWPEMLRVIREIKPKYIVGENVAGLLSWSGGLVFDEVHADLEAEGYEVQAVVIPAAAVNAPHGRDRVWFVARNSKSNGNAKVEQVFGGKDSNTIGICNDDASNSNICTTESSGSSGSIEASRSGNNDEQNKWRGETEFNTGSSKFSQTSTNTDSNGQHERNGFDEINTSEGRQYAQRDTNQGNEHGDAADTLCNRINESRERGQSKQFNKNGIKGGTIADTNLLGSILWNKQNNRELSETHTTQQFNKSGYWETFPTVSPICSRNDGISNRLDGITFSKWRNESIKAAGNAVVPQVVYEIFKAIEATRK